ncbi:MAG: hypothetical protein IKW90_15140 [Lachnospiraceae bacterium]|nr:hypothetical protein [Lachnospiraceae bacterium]
MLTKAITYTDYNGNKKTKNFYFNLTRSELAEMELTNNAGMLETIKKMVNEHDRAKIYGLFEEIVMKSVGEKSSDGEYFEKSDEIRNRFKSHPAYDVLFMELISNEKTMSDFINAILPAEIAANAKANDKTLNDLMGYEVVPSNEENITPIKG